MFREHTPPRDRLRKLVREMTLARHDQLLLDHVAASLLGALLAAVLWVALARFTSLGVAPGPGVVALLVLALLAAIVVARRRRPGALDVVIAADIDLGLQQALSTAWEYEARAAEPALVERLAARAMSARGLPRVGERVFPLRLHRSGKLVPLAALLLLLVSIAEPHRDTVASSATLDPVVALEGGRLREHALAMESRARREGLTRSAEEAQDMQRLGSHMQGGLLSREQALVRLQALTTSLREQSQLAAAEAGGTSLQAGALQGLATPSALHGQPLHELLEKLAAGAITALDLEGLAELASGLAGPVISAEDLQAALDSLEKGDEAALRRLLERLSRMELALRDISELELADEEVLRARRSLGDDDDRGQRGAVGVAGGPRDADDLDGLAGLRGGGRRTGEDSVHAVALVAVRGTGGDAATEASSRARSARDQDTSGPALRPRGQPGAGESRSAEARILPRPGDINVTSVALDSRFATQVEEVLSKEQVPLHQKELIRRYFQSLSAEPDAVRDGTR